MEDKFILDACCGGRMFWFDKKQPNTLYIDNRIREKGHEQNRPNHSVMPDIQMDFKRLDFPDKRFKLIIMDPPHLIGKETTHMMKQYGWLNKETWKEEIKEGFDECWRVLEDYGVLIFKWNEASIKKKEVLSVLNRQPLFGHQILSKIPSHWFCFMKIPSSQTNAKTNSTREKVKQEIDKDYGN